MEEEFVIVFFKDIRAAKENAGLEHMNTFPDFLRTLTDHKLIWYYEIVSKVLNSNGNYTTEDLQKVITFYTFIIKEIELQTDCNTIEIDSEGIWLSTLFSFMTSERFYRQGIIDGYSGCLYDGLLKVKPNKHMDAYANEIYKSLSDEERKRSS